MKILGNATLNHSSAKVYTALNDPEVLLATIPGCQALKQTAQTTYAMTIQAGVASIKGTYIGMVELANQIEPHSFTLRASGSGGPGTVQADVRVTLLECPEGCALTYEADAVVGGVIGGVGQRVLAGVARKTANEFFLAVDQYLSGVRTAIATVSQATDGSVTVAREQSRATNQWSSLIAGGFIAILGVVLGWLISK